MTGETVLGDLAHMLEDLVDVDDLAVHLGLVGEHLHAVHQRADAVGLVADQPGQAAVGGIDVLLQELRRATDARQRVLDLMGKHRRHGGHRPGGIAVGELAVDLARDRAFVEGNDDGAAVLGEGGDLDRHEVGTDLRRLQGDAVFRHRSAALAHLIDQREQRAVARHETGQVLVAEM